MQIHIEELEKLVLEADKIIIEPEGEKVLIKLLALQQQVEEAIDAAKAKLEATALALDPNFTSIQADNVKVYYRAFGSKYYVDEANIPAIPKELYTAETKTVYSVNSKEVDKWVDEHKGLPVGINEVERTKKLSFTLKVKNDKKTA